MTTTASAKPAVAAPAAGAPALIAGRQSGQDAQAPSTPCAGRTLWQRFDATGFPLVASRLAVAGMFTWLAIGKLTQDPHTFAKFVKMYGLLPQDPPELINAVTIVMPWLELSCAVCILLGVCLRGASLVSFLLLAVFTPAIYMHGVDLFNQGQFQRLWDVEFDCGCGVGKQWWVGKMAGNLGLMLASWILFKSRSRAVCLSAKLFGKPIA
ncbi:MAG: DoxX family membrane protein [Phycisphaerales bacterium]|nr:DoxX family membrane protein [Phycisphaerales bacterium]